MSAGDGVESPVALVLALAAFDEVIPVFPEKAEYLVPDRDTERGQLTELVGGPKSFSGR
jgi:hypothetical protein